MALIFILCVALGLGIYYVCGSFAAQILGIRENIWRLWFWQLLLGIFSSVLVGVVVLVLGDVIMALF